MRTRPVHGRLNDRVGHCGSIADSAAATANDGDSERLYLDFNASTPIDAEVVAEMAPFLTADFGNPSGTHWAAAGARDAVETARSEIAMLLGCDATEVVFTSGGTEANNHAIKGVYFAARRRVPKPHFVTQRTEHPSVLDPCKFLKRLGAEVSYLPVDRFGRVAPEDVRAAIRPETVLVSVMHANNETGTIQPIREIAAEARERGVFVHTDASQSVGKISVEVDALGVDLLTVAGHKVYAPKGIGALFVREGLELEPLMHGAGHEAGRRAGTENVLLAVGLGTACRLAQFWLNDDRVRLLTDRLWLKLRERFGERVVLNGHPTERLPNTLNVSFRGQVGGELLGRLPSLAASTGSACHAGRLEVSPVLKAMGVDDSVGLGAVRLSLGRTTTIADIERTVELFARVIK